MFKVTTILYIYDDFNKEESENYVVVNRTIELPFPPYNGLNLRIHHLSHEIKEVTWSIDENSFVCHLQELFTTGGLDDHSFDEWQEYFQFDWSSSGPHPIENY
jgi:hypothetical protein